MIDDEVTEIFSIDIWKLVFQTIKKEEHIYSGYTFEDEFHGKGTLIYKDGKGKGIKKVIGYFNWGVLKWARIEYTNNDTYEGETNYEK